LFLQKALLLRHLFTRCFKMKRYILGVSCFYHDSAAALVHDGVILGAVQEERFSRKKNDPDFPVESIRYLLDLEGISFSQIDAVVYYEKPFITFERLMASYISDAPRGLKSFLLAIPLWIKKKLFLKALITKELQKFDTDFEPTKLLFSEHHLSHAAGSFFTSGFDQAVILVLDGVGEWATASVAVGNANTIAIKKEINFPHSLGLIYSAFTGYLGFEINEGEYKMMGLAPYGRPRYAELIKDKLIDIKEDGSFRLNMDFFDFVSGLKMTNKNFHQLFGQEPRVSEEQLTPFHTDLAASIQSVTEEILLKMVAALSKEYGMPNLCLSGGVALNCVANGKILDSGYFKNIWIQPASGDAGGAVGAALVGTYIGLKTPRNKEKDKCNKSPYLGPGYSQATIEKDLCSVGAVFQVIPFEEIVVTTASLLSKGNVVGWFQDRCEFGPRALGNRSILADPTIGTMQRDLNMRIKYREGFRPFAPAVLSEKASEWFDISVDSPYMLFVRQVAQAQKLEVVEKSENSSLISHQLNKIGSSIPAVTHVDFTSRVQTVSEESNTKFYSLIREFDRITNCPILVNTSMNVRGEPIVCSPEDAFRCFMTAKLDYLVIGNCILKKEDQYPNW